MTRHIDALAISFYAFAALIGATLLGTAALTFGIGLIEVESMIVMAPTAVFVGGLGVVLTGAYGLVGYGLKTRAWWARGAALAAAVTVVGSLPFGTALGVFSFITLLDSDVSEAFAA